MKHLILIVTSNIEVSCLAKETSLGASNFDRLLKNRHRTRPSDALQMEGFVCTTQFTWNGAVPVYRYKSKRTGLQVVLAQAQGNHQ